MRSYQWRVPAVRPDRKVDAIYNCTGGATGEIKFTGLMSEKGGITGTYTGKDKSCSFRGNVGGMRVMQ